MTDRAIAYFIGLNREGLFVLLDVIITAVLFAVMMIFSAFSPDHWFWILVKTTINLMIAGGACFTYWLILGRPTWLLWAPGLIMVSLIGVSSTLRYVGLVVGLIYAEGSALILLLPIGWGGAFLLYGLAAILPGATEEGEEKRKTFEEARETGRNIGLYMFYASVVGATVVWTASFAPTPLVLGALAAVLVAVPAGIASPGRQETLFSILGWGVTIILLGQITIMALYALQAYGVIAEIQGPADILTKWGDKITSWTPADRKLFWVLLGTFGFYLIGQLIAFATGNLRIGANTFRFALVVGAGAGVVYMIFVYIIPHFFPETAGVTPLRGLDRNQQIFWLIVGITEIVILAKSLFGPVVRSEIGNQPAYIKPKWEFPWGKMLFLFLAALLFWWLWWGDGNTIYGIYEKYILPKIGLPKGG